MQPRPDRLDVYYGSDLVGAVHGRGQVRVFSGKELTGLLKSRGARALTAQDIQRIAHQVEQRCRTVTPLYAQEPKAS